MRRGVTRKSSCTNTPKAFCRSFRLASEPGMMASKVAGRLATKSSRLLNVKLPMEVKSEV